jgi:hypothetical protein
MASERRITGFGGVTSALTVVYWAFVAHLAIKAFKCTDYDDIVDRCASIDALRLFFVIGSVFPYLVLLAFALLVRQYTRKAP